MNSNKIFLLFGFMATAFFCGFSHASGLLVFDSPSLIIVRSGERLYGYYGALEKNNSCMFFFTGNSRNHGKTKDGVYSTLDVVTYALDSNQYHYTQRDKQYDMPGKIYIMGDQWIIQTTGEPPGCGGATGFFHLGPYDHDVFRYYVSNEISAVGIRVASKKTSFYERRGVLFSKRKAYITPGDVVTVLKISGDFSYARYTNPDYFNPTPGKVISGWIRTSDLENPFPLP